MSARAYPFHEPALPGGGVKRKVKGPRGSEKRPLDETGNEIWLLTLSDLLMLLMIFFVLLLGWGFHSRYQLAEAPQSAPSTAAPPVPSDPDRSIATTVALFTSAPPSAPFGAETAIWPLESDLISLVGDDQAVTIERRSDHLVATFPERLLFDSGQSELKRAIEPVLNKLAWFIRIHPELSVAIEGHTDDRPIHNRRFASNWELSADRATQVAKTLVALGVDPTRLSTRGYGEYHPRCANDSDENRLKNRRVEIQFSEPVTKGGHRGM